MTNSSSTRPYQVKFSTKIVHLHVVTTHPHGTTINTDLKQNVPMGPRSPVVDFAFERHCLEQFPPSGPFAIYD
jgi:hypothetical protein